MSSEKSITASVFSSCGGRGALTAARIHGGVSARAAGAPERSRSSGRARALPLPVGRLATGLQDDLLFIGCPHDLIEGAQCRVVLLLERNQIAANTPFEMQRAFFVLDLHQVGHRFDVGVV